MKTHCDVCGEHVNKVGMLKKMATRKGSPTRHLCKQCRTSELKNNLR